MRNVKPDLVLPEKMKKLISKRVLLMSTLSVDYTKKLVPKI